MGSLGNQKPWLNMNTKDCSQGFCSLYCPQWCYIFPPPPPFEFPDDGSGPNFSPLVIAIIGILASAFLLVSYYAIISKYCRNRDSSRRENQYPVLESEENQEPANHEPWHVPTNGLEESLIKSITILKYKKGDGLIEGTDCSVCLSEFQEEESLRLLPKCSHAFHAMCIDTWLKSHSNCPLCRANIVFVSPLPPVSETPPPPPPPNESLFQSSPEIEEVAAEEDIEMGTREGDSETNISKTPSTQPSDIENSDVHSSSSASIDDEGEQIRRRSESMDYLFPGRLSIADILQINDDEDEQSEEHRLPEDAGTSKWPAAEMSRSNNRSRVLHCVTSPTAMKRSSSSGRFLFPKRARGRNIILPL